MYGVICLLSRLYFVCSTPQENYGIYILGLGPYFCFSFLFLSRVSVESGMKLSVLCRILETVSLSLDVYGRIPDLTICDAIAVGQSVSNITSTGSSTILLCLMN